MNIELLTKRIDDIAFKWDASGAIIINHLGKPLYNKLFGFQDRENQLPMNVHDTFLMSTRSTLLLGMSMLILVEQHKISLEDTLDQYIPDYSEGKRITIKDLVYHNSGIPDYYYEVQMLALQQSIEYNNLSDHDKFIQEKMMLERTPSFHTILDMVNHLPLTFIPGTRDTDFSYTNAVFMEEIITRLSGQSLFDFEQEHIFLPLKMNGVTQSSSSSTVSYGILHQEIKIRLPFDQHVSHSICYTVADLIKLMNGLQQKKILNRNTWRLALAYNNSGVSPMFEQINGVHCAATEMLGYEFNLYLDFNAKLSYVHLTNEMQVLKRQNDEWHYLRKDLRKAIEEETTFPTNPKLSKYEESNAWDAMSLSIDPSQQSFVLDAKTTIGYYLIKQRVRRLYVLTDGGRTIGLMVLTIEPKIDHFHVDVLLIDKKFQHRGYGKFMLSKGLEILKKHGARKIEIGVSRRNIAAQKLYFRLGFKTAAIYQDGMSLVLEF